MAAALRPHDRDSRSGSWELVFHDREPRTYFEKPDAVSRSTLPDVAVRGLACGSLLGFHLPLWSSRSCLRPRCGFNPMQMSCAGLLRNPGISPCSSWAILLNTNA